jgi:two-component system NtrC family sensor kinase
MDLYAISGLVNGLTATAVGAYVFTRGYSDPRYQTYGLFCLSLSLWSYSYYFWLVSRTPEEAMFWVKCLMAGAIFIPLTNLHHILELLKNPPAWKRWIWLGYLACLGFLYYDLFSNLFVRGVSEKLGFPFWPEPGPAFHVFLLFFFCCVVYFVYLLAHEVRGSSGLRQNQLKYLILALSLGYLGGATNFPLWYDVPVLPIGNILVSFYVLLFCYAVIKFRLLDIEILIKRGLIYAFTLLGLLIPCYLLTIAAQQFLFGSISYTFSIFTLCLFLVVAFLFPKFRFRTEEALERVLFHKRTNYRETLLRSSREMVSIVDLENLSNSLVKTVSRALGTGAASLYLLDETKGVYNLKAKIGRERDAYPQTMLLKTDPLVQRLTGNQEGVLKEELEMSQDKIVGLQVAEKMGELEAEISLPIVSKRKLIGILNLGHKEGKEIYSSEDLELLSTLANQAAIAIENARLYENLKQSQDTLRRADRLSSLGLLTAGLAHEIRNPLVAIRTFTQLLPERYDDAEFREGFQGLALKEVDRICGLINDLLSFARPSRPNVAEENMNDVVDGIARILETEAKEKSVEIIRDFGLNLPRVWIDREQMKQVFMNLILNAIQAMREGGSIFISTRLTSKEEAGRSGQFVQVEIRDTGVGIPSENLDHIFDPFFTNKDEGSGLGLSISHQIVQEHGGYVTVESKVGVGTAFFINLPTGKPIRQLSNGRAHANEANLSH